jgi:hypothetical protein
LAIALAKGAMPTSELEVSRGKEKRDSLQLAVQMMYRFDLFNNLLQLSEVIIEHVPRRLEHLKDISLKGRAGSRPLPRKPSCPVYSGPSRQFVATMKVGKCEAHVGTEEPTCRA